MKSSAFSIAEDELESGSAPGAEPERYELHEARTRPFNLDRRGFLRSLGGGILVFHLLSTAGAQQPGGGRRRGGGAVSPSPRTSPHGCTSARTAGSGFTPARPKSARTSVRR